MRPSRLTFLGIGLLALAVAAVGCGKSGGGGGVSTPTGRQVSVSTASPTNTMAAGGSLFLTVTVIGANDEPENGVPVTLTTTLGRLDASTGVTGPGSTPGTSGLFSTSLRTSAGETGTAIVRAQEQLSGVTGQVEITVQ